MASTLHFRIDDPTSTKHHQCDHRWLKSIVAFQYRHGLVRMNCQQTQTSQKPNNSNLRLQSPQTPTPDIKQTETQNLRLQRTQTSTPTSRQINPCIQSTQTSTPDIKNMENKSSTSKHPDINTNIKTNQSSSSKHSDINTRHQKH